MWFRNLTIFRLDAVPSAKELEASLSTRLLKPCGKTEPFSFGWISPFGGKNPVLAHEVNQFILLTSCKEERILPSSVINEQLEEKIEQIELQEMRKVFKKEKARLKEELIFQLMPKAFTRKLKTEAYLDIRQKLLVVNTSSLNRAEEFVSLLRETVGHLKAIPLTSQMSPQEVLTDWVTTDSELNFVLEDSCEMIIPEQSGAVIKYNKTDLYAADIKAQLNTGKRVKKIALTWRDSLSFILEDTLLIRRIRPLSVIVEKRQEIFAETEAEKIDQEFSLMTLEYSALIREICEQMGGLQPFAEEPLENDKAVA